MAAAAMGLQRHSMGSRRAILPSRPGLRLRLPRGVKTGSARQGRARACGTSLQPRHLSWKRSPETVSRQIAAALTFAMLHFEVPATRLVLETLRPDTTCTNSRVMMTA